MNKLSALRVVVLGLVVVLLLLSCDLPLPFSPASPGETPVPPTATAKPTVPVPPTPTRDASMVSAAANEDLTIYATPSTTAQTIGQLSKGDKARVVGKTQAGDWWQIVFLTGPNQRGWIASQAVTMSGPVETIPVVQSQPAPTAQAPGSPTAATPPRATPTP